MKDMKNQPTGVPEKEPPFAGGKPPFPPFGGQKPPFPPFGGGMPPFPKDGMKFGPPEGFTPPPLTDVSGIKNKHLDVPYATASKSQVLDLFLPAEGEGPFPTLLYIHGGGFALGDKRDGHLKKLLECLDRGWALAAIEYRLSGEALFPAAVQDCRSATRYLRANAEKYHLDPTRFAAMGGSAGGNLSAMLAAAAKAADLDDPACPHNALSCAVCAAVDWFGPTDFTVMDQQARENGFSFCDHDMPHSAESCYLGKPLPECDQAQVQRANPIHYLDSDMAPILIEHGSNDHLVPPAQSLLLYDAILQKLGAGYADYHVLDGADHEDDMFESDENMARVWAFLKKYLG